MIENYEHQINKLTDLSILIFSSYETDKSISFKDAFKSFNGFAFQSKSYVNNSENKLITIKNIDDNGFNSTSVSFLSDDIINNTYLLDIGDILLTMTGNIGRYGIVDEYNCYLNQRVLKLECKSKLYLYCFLIKHKEKIISLGKGTAQLNLSLKDLYKIKVDNSSEEIDKFKFYDFIFFKIVNLKVKIKKLKKIKASLLFKYF